MVNTNNTMAGIYTTTFHVASSNLKAVGWGTLNNRDILEVEFLSGSAYIYYSVPWAEATGLMHADSKGKYLHRNIKGYYAYKKIRTNSGHLLVTPPQKQPEPEIKDPVIQGTQPKPKIKAPATRRTRRTPKPKIKAPVIKRTRRAPKTTYTKPKPKPKPKPVYKDTVEGWMDE